MVPERAPTTRQEQAERYSIGAVSKALVLLDALADHRSLSLGDAAEAAGASKSSAYRLLATLEAAGLAERLPEGGYRAGAGAIRWASQLLGQLDVRTVAEPTLRRLRDETGETVNLAVLRDTSLIYVEDPGQSLTAANGGRARGQRAHPRHRPWQVDRHPPRSGAAGPAAGSGAIRGADPGHSDDLERSRRAPRRRPPGRLRDRRRGGRHRGRGWRRQILAGTRVAGAISVSAHRARMDDTESRSRDASLPRLPGASASASRLRPRQHQVRRDASVIGRK